MIISGIGFNSDEDYKNQYDTGVSFNIEDVASFVLVDENPMAPGHRYPIYKISFIDGGENKYIYVETINMEELQRSIPSKENLFNRLLSSAIESNEK